MLITILTLAWLSLIILAVCEQRAPEGYEDETGFHYGRISQDGQSLRFKPESASAFHNDRPS